MIETLRRQSLGTLRHQLTVGVVLVIAATMALFVWDLTLRQRDVFLERQAESSVGLTQALATAAAGALVARDLAGLQELVDAQRQFPVLEFAMLLDTQGRALAHTDRARLGQFVRDLPIKAETVTLARLAELVDVATPVVLNGRPVGWARVGLARRVAIRTGEDIALEGVEALARALESVMAEIEHPDQLE